MWYHHLFILLGSFFSFLCWADEGNSSSVAEPFSDDRFFAMMVDGNNRFGFDFYHKIKNQPGNLCFSPYSIASGLAMAASGAKGQTASELQRTLHYSLSLIPLTGDLKARFSLSAKEGTQVLLANAFWFQKDLFLQNSFKLTIERDLQAEFQFVDFAKELGKAVQIINHWVSQQTKGKINQLLNSQDLTEQTRLVLTTALYMKGAWKQPFDSKVTKRLPFQVTPHRSFLTNMMQSTSSFFLLKDEKWDLLEIPYRSEDGGMEIAMTLLLPKSISLDDLENQLTWDNWKQWITMAKMQPVKLTMPQFRMERRLDLNTVLKSLGLSLIFSTEADFSAITGKKNLFLNKAIHKTYFQVDENGTESVAAAALPLNNTPAATAEPPYEFRADHPFLFIIWDKKTKAILLIGRLEMP